MGWSGFTNQPLLFFYLQLITRGDRAGLVFGSLGSFTARVVNFVSTSRGSHKPSMRRATFRSGRKGISAS
jgi:hypothetical protein